MSCQIRTGPLHIPAGRGLHCAGALQPPAVHPTFAVHSKAQYMARDMSEETKDATITIRVRPSVKAKAVKRAHQEARSLANYIERLIEQDAKAKSTKS
jgi:hypothetical protein